MKKTTNAGTRNYTIAPEIWIKAREMFEPFVYGQPEECRDSPRRFYVRTILGYLEVDLLSLLYLTARIVHRRDVTEIDESVLDTAFRLVEQLPEYLEQDILGMACQEIVREDFDLEITLRRRTEGDQKTSSESGIRLFELLFRRMGPAILESDRFRKVFIGLFSSEGGRKAWNGFVKSKVRIEKRPGRPRKEEYDLIYQQRKGEAPVSYGKLIRRISNKDSDTANTLLNRAKAAVAYRKRQDQSSKEG